MKGWDAGIYGNHPYAPTDLKLPGFVPGFLSQSSIVGVSSLLVVSLTCLFSGRSPRKSKLDRWLMCWWDFTGLTHLILEGYLAFEPEFYKDKTVWYPAEVCEVISNRRVRRIRWPKIAQKPSLTKG